MPRSTEQIKTQLETLEANFKKEFAGHSPGNLIREVLEHKLAVAQRGYVENTLISWKGEDLANALEHLASLSKDRTYILEVPEAPDVESFIPPKKLGKGKKAKA